MKLSEGVLISLLTGLAYLMAFAHEMGAARAFGIPSDLVDLQLLPSLFKAVFALGILAVLVHAADPLYRILRPSADEHPVWRALRVPIALFILGFAFLLVGGRTVQPLWVWVGFPLAYMLAHLIPLGIVLYRIRHVGFVEALRQIQLADAQFQGPLNRVIFGSHAWVTHFSVIAMVLVALSFTAGYAQAKRQNVFFITNQQPETVVLRIYGDRIITAQFVREERKTKRLYEVLRVDKPGLVLREEALGPLSVEDVLPVNR